MALISSVRILPHIVLFFTHPHKEVIQYETKRWLEILRLDFNLSFGFVYLMTFFPEYRNLFYKRIGNLSMLIRWSCPKMNTLFIDTDNSNIGKGLFIQHGFATIIAAKSVGEDCWINQQVTIGFANESDAPVIGKNNTISAGAKVIGNVVTGESVRIGANSVVVKNVPDKCTIVGVPAYIIKRNGQKVKESL